MILQQHSKNLYNQLSIQIQKINQFLNAKQDEDKFKIAIDSFNQKNNVQQIFLSYLFIESQQQQNNELFQQMKNYFYFVIKTNIQIIELCLKYNQILIQKTINHYSKELDELKILFKKLYSQIDNFIIDLNYIKIFLTFNDLIEKKDQSQNISFVDLMQNYHQKVVELTHQNQLTYLQQQVVKIIERTLNQIYQQKWQQVQTSKQNQQQQDEQFKDIIQQFMSVMPTIQFSYQIDEKQYYYQSRIYSEFFPTIILYIAQYESQMTPSQLHSFNIYLMKQNLNLSHVKKQLMNFMKELNNDLMECIRQGEIKGYFHQFDKFEDNYISLNNLFEFLLDTQKNLSQNLSLKIIKYFQRNLFTKEDLNLKLKDIKEHVFEDLYYHKHPMDYYNFIEKLIKKIHHNADWLIYIIFGKEELENTQQEAHKKSTTQKEEQIQKQEIKETEVIQNLIQDKKNQKENIQDINHLFNNQLDDYIYQDFKQDNIENDVKVCSSEESIDEDKEKSIDNVKYERQLDSDEEEMRDALQLEQLTNQLIKVQENDQSKEKKIVHHLGNKKSNYKPGTNVVKNKTYAKKNIF